MTNSKFLKSVSDSHGTVLEMLPHLKSAFKALISLIEFDVLV